MVKDVIESSPIDPKDIKYIDGDPCILESNGYEISVEVMNLYGLSTQYIFNFVITKGGYFVDSDSCMSLDFSKKMKVYGDVFNYMHK